MSYPNAGTRTSRFSDSNIDDLPGTIRQWTLLAHIHRSGNVHHRFFLLLVHYRFKRLVGDRPAFLDIPRYKGRQLKLTYYV